MSPRLPLLLPLLRSAPFPPLTKVTSSSTIAFVSVSTCNLYFATIALSVTDLCQFFPLKNSLQGILCFGECWDISVLVQLPFKKQMFVNMFCYKSIKQGIHLKIRFSLPDYCTAIWFSAKQASCVDNLAILFQ